MSGIWGFSCDHSSENHNKIQALDFWTGYYGAEGSDWAVIPSGAFGCHIEHLSEDYPCSDHILKSGSYSSVIDAIIYNRKEIAQQMEFANLSHLSDEELLFSLWLEKGYQAFASVNGDFAGAIYDERDGSWTLFRDHLGIRPLFYYLDNQQFAFSTDIRGLTALPDVDLKLNEIMFYQNAAGYNALSLCDTEYANIHCVRPASQMTFSHKQLFEVKTEVYWNLGQKKVRFRDPEEYPKELRRLIIDSVQRRLNAVSGLIGAELSGGLDSCMIDVLINRLGREAVYYSWSYDPKDLPLQKDRDERDIILDICKQEGISCHFTSMPKMATVTEIKDMMKHIDPPYMNTPQLAAGSKWMHSQGARVVFTGHGGDEGVSHRGNLTGEFRSSRAGCEILSPAFTDRICKIAPHPSLPFAYDPVAYTMQGGPGIRMYNAASQGAENGVRYMFPFLDYRVFDYAVSIPRWQFNCGEGNRAVYRKAFYDLMPESLRRMHYKDTPSMTHFSIPDMDYSREFLKSKQQMIEFLDWDFWGQYLDKDAVESIMPAEDVNSPEYTYAGVKMNVLLKCCMIQNTMKNTKKNRGSSFNCAPGG